AVGIEVVSWTNSAFKIRRRIAGTPVQQIKLGIIRAGHPRASAAVQVQVTRPAFGTEFAGSGDGPETPGKFSGERVVGCDEAANSIITARSTDYDFVLHDQRCGGRAVIFVPVCVGDIPNQVTRARVQAEQVRIIGLAINSGMPNAHAPADVARGVVNEAFAVGARMMPDRA